MLLLEKIRYVMLRISDAHTLPLRYLFLDNASTYCMGGLRSEVFFKYLDYIFAGIVLPSEVHTFHASGFTSVLKSCLKGWSMC